MGSDLQRRDDDGGRDRPVGTSQRHHRAEHSELPGGARKAETTGGQPGSERMRRRGGGGDEKTNRGESCGNDGLWKAWKAKSRLPPLSTSPLEISPTEGEI